MGTEYAPSRVVGILGGMGPSATADFYTKLIAHTPASTDQEHLRVVIWADPTVPSRQDAILANGLDPSPWLKTGLQRLQDCGAEIVVVPCNTVHRYLPSVMEGQSTEFISIIDTTIQAVQRITANGVIGLLATDGALLSGIYQKALTDAGYSAAQPSAEDQSRLMEIVHSVKAGDTKPELFQGLSKILANLESQGVHVAIVGCTELSTLLEQIDSSGPMRLIDPAIELATATVARARQQV
ncbi:aspartate/glutamate racemase family protein (plasmid) [Glutamicibacter soli]|uniref:aspartate/glutamate racemase family protein n=1 Tax=Glutamicibacter soli TaxID=453836 RepID=UPI003C76EE5E